MTQHQKPQRGKKHWTKADDALLRQLWNEGLSGQEIADRLGVGKNSALGRAHRLQLPIHPSRRHQHAQCKPEGKHVKQVAYPINATLAETIGEWRETPKARGCQWIDGDPHEDATKCGQPIKKGSRFSFCDEHHARCFRTPKNREPNTFEGSRGGFKLGGWR